LIIYSTYLTYPSYSFHCLAVRIHTTTIQQLKTNLTLHTTCFIIEYFTKNRQWITSTIQKIEFLFTDSTLTAIRVKSRTEKIESRLALVQWVKCVAWWADQTSFKPKITHQTALFAKQQRWIDINCEAVYSIISDKLYLRTIPITYFQWNNRISKRYTTTIDNSVANLTVDAGCIGNFINQITISSSIGIIITHTWITYQITTNFTNIA
jgi:hypothetical protein